MRSCQGGGRGWGSGAVKGVRGQGWRAASRPAAGLKHKALRFNMPHAPLGLAAAAQVPAADGAVGAAAVERVRRVRQGKGGVRDGFAVPQQVAGVAQGLGVDAVGLYRVVGQRSGQAGVVVAPHHLEHVAGIAEIVVDARTAAAAREARARRRRGGGRTLWGPHLRVFIVAKPYMHHEEAFRQGAALPGCGLGSFARRRSASSMRGRRRLRLSAMAAAARSEAPAPNPIAQVT
jgi:hypothetical protein